MDRKERVLEIAKLKKLKRSRPVIIADFRRNPNTWAKIGHDLDINLDTVLQLASPGKDQALGHVLDDLGLQMRDTPYSQSSKMSDTGGLGTAEDMAVAAYMQRLYTIGSRYPRHPMVAAFTLSPVTSGSTFNPYTSTPVREEQEIAPEVDYTEFLGESMNIMDDVTRIPLYQDKPRERKHKRVTELGQIEVESFSFTEDAKAIYKYGIGIQWSYETSFKEVLMQLLGFWVMRRAIEDRILFLQDLLATAISFAHAKSRTHTIAAAGAAGKWTVKKLLDYNKRWRVPYMYNWLIAEPNAITTLELTDFGSDNWTLGHFAMSNGNANIGYENARMGMRKRYIDIPDLVDEEDGNAFTDATYLFMDSMRTIGQFYNTGMARDETEVVMGNQSYIRYFTIGNRFYPIIPSAVEVVTLA